MEWVETTGRTVEEAKDAALDQLGVGESDAEFVVVTEPKAGLFGRMRGEARVRARVTPTSPRPKRTRSRRPEPRRQGGGRRPSSRSADGDNGSADGATAVAVGDGSGDDAGGGSAAGNGSGSSGAPKRRRSRSGAKPAGGTSSGSEGGGRNQPRAKANQRQRRIEGNEEEAVGEVLTLEEQGDTAGAFIQGLLAELGLQGDVTTRVVDADTAEVAVEGSELGVLIGPSGATLAALQELARTVVQRRTGGHTERILVDVAGYRAKRAAALQRFTRQVAEEVLAASEEKALEPMSASDRKVVHDTVNDIEGVVTRSEGEDPRRYIVISPVPGSSPVAQQDSPGDDDSDDSPGDDDA